MKAIYDVPAPAKLNLFLHITGRRPDGYHLLESVFMLIDWCDTLHFELRAHRQISREDLGPTLPAEDLCVRAARALQAATGCNLGVHIGIDKRIPAQAGMGGGSSDAASTLLALNRLWDLRLSLAQLHSIAISLGADVPFFLCGHNAWVSGIGDIITPLVNESALPKARFLVVKPETGLDTKKIFSSSFLKRNTSSATIAGFAAAHYDFGHNDLQGVAQTLCPDITSSLNWLASNKMHGRMTGSGSSVFAQIPHTASLTEAPSNCVVRECENLMVHPLAEWI